ncbi:MAG TPA: Ig-like domain-containing protein [Anaeromyxobacter sp.]|nr:Ig-like domain-containing protein [Anaeromyxobacter sp.]
MRDRIRHELGATIVLAVVVSACSSGDPGGAPPANRAPVAAADAYAVFAGQTLTVPAPLGVLANDSDPDGDPLTAAIASAPGSGALILAPDGSLAFTAGAEAGTVQFTYVASDGDATSEPATVTIVVSAPGAWVADDLGTIGLSYAVALDGAHVYVVGSAPAHPDGAWRVEKRSAADGSLVPVFGTAGAASSDPTTGRDEARAVAAGGGWVYVGGCDAPFDTRWRIEKRSATDGSLAPEFGTGGVVIVDSGAGDERVLSLLLDGTDLYAVGTDWGSPATDAGWRIEKRSAVTGALDPTFGSGGAVLSNPTSSFDEAAAVAFDGTALYVAGTVWDDIFDRSWRVEKRLASSGALDPDFGAGGILSFDPTPGLDYARAVAVGGGAIFVSGGDTPVGGWERWRVEKRSARDGTLAAGFGSGGILSVDPGPWHDEVRAVALDGEALWLAGGESVASADGRWRVEKRSAASGDLVPAFATGGVYTLDPVSAGGQYEFAHAIAVGPAHVYVTGWRVPSSSSTENSWRTEAIAK